MLTPKYLQDRVEGDIDSLITHLDLRQAIETLSEKEKQAVVLYYIEDYSMEEVSQQMGLNKSTVSRLVGKALEQLKQKIG